MSRAGLGLSLHDVVYGSEFRTAFDVYWDYAKRNYLSLRDNKASGPVTMYYDPLLPYHQPGDRVAMMKFGPAHGVLPMYPDDARALYEAGVNQLDWRSPAPIGSGEMRFSAPDVLLAMFMAREFGDDALHAKLKAYSEAHDEPNWDTETGEFTWQFGLDEEHPRGQLNATAAMAEAAGPGAWSDLINRPNQRKFLEPTVYGVDFPKVCLSQAYYDIERRLLAIATDSGAPGAVGEPTSFRVTNVIPESCVVEIDGGRIDDWRAVDGDLEISTTVDKHTVVIRCT